MVCATYNIQCTEDENQFRSFKRLFKTLLLKRLFIKIYTTIFPPLLHSMLVDADQMVQWLGKPAAVPEVPGSNPG